MPAASRVALVGRLVLVAAVAVVAFVFFGWLAVRVAVSGSADPAPDLIGMSGRDALERLHELDMEAEIDPIRLPVESLEAGAVARQDPGPGTPLKRMRTVRLMVGDSRNLALIALQQQNFEVDYVAGVHSSEVPRDTIIAQEPTPAELPPGATAPLRLLTSLGSPPRTYVMVDLIGRQVDAVRPYLEARGFRVTEGPNRRAIANVPPGVIVGQRPDAGFRVMHGAEITLQVSR